MRRRTPLAIGCALLVVFTLGFATPLTAAPPLLRIQDMDAARASFEDSTAEWDLYAEVSYVFADSVRYQDNSVVRPHTDVDVSMWACPVDLTGECTPMVLRGTENMGDKPQANGEFTTSMEKAWLDSVLVELCVDEWYPGCVVVGEVEIVEVDWTAVGPVEKLKIITPGIQTLVGKTRDATATGTVKIESAPPPFNTFATSYSTFFNVVLQNYNEVLHDE